MRLSFKLLVAYLGLATTVFVFANPITITNKTSKAHTYTVTSKGSTDEEGHQRGPQVVTVDVPANTFIMIGGPKSDVPFFLGIEFSLDVETQTVALNNKISSMFFPESVTSEQSALLLADSTGSSDVFSFFDFDTPNYKALIANTPFDFVGFGPGRTPILTVAGTNIAMTDSFGQLLPTFQFTGEPEVLGEVTITPESATFFPGLAFLILIALRNYSRRDLTHP